MQAWGVPTLQEPCVWMSRGERPGAVRAGHRRQEQPARKRARDCSAAGCYSKLQYNKDETGPLEGKQEITADLTSEDLREVSGLQARPDVKGDES